VVAELWCNRAGNQRALVTLAHPTTEHELCRIVADVADRGGHLKAVGAGHSLTDVGLTDGTLLSLQNYGRVLAFDPDEGLLTAQAGAKLHDLSLYLRARGFAFESLGDMNNQTIAGATSTATHGTGAAFANLSAGIAGMRIIDGAGGVHDASPEGDRELLRVARVGVGALGLVSSLTMKVVPAFNLHVSEQARRLGEVIETFTDLVAGNDHFEFLCVPHTEWALVRTRRRNHEPLRPRNRFSLWQQESSIPRCIRGFLHRIGGALPEMVPRSTGRVLSMATRDYNEPSYEGFATPRGARFLEMEYAVPLGATMEAFEEVRGWIERAGTDAVLPIGVRTSAGDDIALSPAAARPSGYIAVRAHRRSPYEAYFRAVEQIMLGHDGRPHWGKLHFRSEADLAPAYPQWGAFQAARSRMDPTGVFQNAYTRRCLGPVA
jgi:L-gulonolactone oxidase